MAELGATAAVPAATRREARAASQFWWLYLVLGAGWLLFAIIIFRFDWTSVSSIAILFGTAMLAAGAAELLAVIGASQGWKIAHALLGLAFVAIGVVSYIHPGDTFSALAGVMSFYFIVKGMFDLALGLATIRLPVGWLRLTAGIAEIVIGFWAAGDFGHKTVLLLVWVGSAALIRGITDITAAFALRG